MPEAQSTVYILRSTVQPHRYYVGKTSKLKHRVSVHNGGQSQHTASGCPWRVVASIDFADADKAGQLEKYLKSGSGQAFARRHFR